MHTHPCQISDTVLGSCHVVTVNHTWTGTARAWWWYFFPTNPRRDFSPRWHVLLCLPSATMFYSSIWDLGPPWPASTYIPHTHESAICPPKCSTGQPVRARRHEEAGLIQQQHTTTACPRNTAGLPTACLPRCVPDFCHDVIGATWKLVECDIIGQQGTIG